VDEPRSSTRIVVTLASLKPFFFNAFKKTLPCSDNVGASAPGIHEERPVILIRRAQGHDRRGPALARPRLPAVGVSSHAPSLGLLLGPIRGTRAKMRKARTVPSTADISRPMPAAMPTAAVS